MWSLIGPNRILSLLPGHEPVSQNQLLKYEPTISQELNSYGLKSYTPLLLAIMLQESKGEGSDPMQASESAGLKRNQIKNPETSIKQGVYHFSEMYKFGKQKHVDLDTIIQSYNMGPGYISYVAERGQEHKETLAKSYSKMKVEKSPNTYTCGIRDTFREPYCYGDFTYAEKVNKQLALVQTILKDKDSTKNDSKAKTSFVSK
ncbi:transglycosylase SLT domain-containing protein [Terrilactibacillus sp. BCM23-1]|uniref:Transglycosylase SLT domain-containing protein n=2 Tax=Terrilactibacillus tamarindi TaxID=2599694 RepID=A0A6N8CMF6_9BACI|nr:lysozyme family protein [Terrilactibacillus tamarindi]MTT30788.1 transglycosylase SLT domain-containing protein [Terrilactibacillus tamarindi]